MISRLHGRNEPSHGGGARQELAVQIQPLPLSSPLQHLLVARIFGICVRLLPPRKHALVLGQQLVVDWEDSELGVRCDKADENRRGEVIRERGALRSVCSRGYNVPISAPRKSNKRACDSDMLTIPGQEAKDGSGAGDHDRPVLPSEVPPSEPLLGNSVPVSEVEDVVHRNLVAGPVIA